jgi:hypothetical protein
MIFSLNHTNPMYTIVWYCRIESFFMLPSTKMVKMKCYVCVAKSIFDTRWVLQERNTPSPITYENHDVSHFQLNMLILQPVNKQSTTLTATKVQGLCLSH